MAWDSAPVYVKVSLGLTISAFLLHLLGFSTNYWSSTSVNQNFGSGGFNIQVNADANSGLWRSCFGDGTTSVCGNASGPSWFEATQAFETLGFIAAIAALVLIVLYIFVPQTAGKRIIFILGMVACFVAAGCILLGIIIYGSKAGGHLSWSYALCTIAGIIFGVSGILLVVDMLKR